MIFSTFLLSLIELWYIIAGSSEAAYSLNWGAQKI